jgi:polyferredoxin
MTLEPGTLRTFADVVLVLHAAYVLFVVAGQILIVTGWALGWGWTRQLIFRLTHLGVIGLVLLEAWVGLSCPLTVLENRLRAETGTQVYEQSFIGHWLDHLIFYSAPEWVFTFIYSVFFGFVILMWVVYPPRRKLR